MLFPAYRIILSSLSATGSYRYQMPVLEQLQDPLTLFLGVANTAITTRCSKLRYLIGLIS